MTDPRRELPAIERLLQDPAVAALMDDAPRGAVVAAAREAVAAARRSRAGAPDDWAREIRERLDRRLAPSLVPVLNATGVVLHTNLGRAPLAETAVAAVVAVARGYGNLEFDLHGGVRGDRGSHCRTRLSRISGAEDALAVNNAAAALVLALNTVADGRAVVISRGELIEIGGSFRIPEILGKSGARLHEIGTTNRTHLDDYRAALEAGAGAVLLVHRSNFEQRGFVATPAPGDVAALARSAGVPLLHDIGSGLVADLSAHGLRGEPRVPEAVAAGADLVVFSGDKLLGGPQAGLLVGRRDLIAGCRRNPLARAMRADKLTLAALDATLALYDDPDRALREVPVLAMLTVDPAQLAERAARLAALCSPALAARVEPGFSAVGGGAFPAASLPTSLVIVDPGALGADGLALRLRLGRPAVVARVEAGRLLLDPRTLPEDSLSLVAAALAAAAG